MGTSVLDNRLRGGALQAADRIFVPGRFTASLLDDWHVDQGHAVHVPYGADPHPRVPVPEGSTLLSVARLIPRKGVDTVIRAMPRLPAQVEYRVVGTGPDQSRLHALAEAEGVAHRVSFLGRLDDAALEQEYRRATVFVLPARRTADGDLEGYGLVYFEAAAWGRPVIAGRSGGEIDAVEDGQTGMLVDGTSVDAVAETIASLLGDRQRLQLLGAAGRKRVEGSHNWTCAAAVIDRTLAALA
jgi:phosphatidylinositol alpha-1,6-mannosyltransferase